MPQARIDEELKLFERSTIDQIFVLDPTFNSDKKIAKSILRSIKEYAPDIHYTFEVRAEFIDEELAQLFSEINCTLQIGVQSTNVESLKLINRKFDPDDFIEKISILNNYGISFGFDLIYGLPGDTIDDFKDSLDFTVDLQPNNIDIFPLSVMPGTVLFDRADQLGVKFLKLPPYRVIENRTMSKEILAKAEKLANSFDLFYNRGKAVSYLFMILETLNLKASEFLSGFTADRGLDEDKFIEALIDFTVVKFRGRGASKYIDIIKDVINLHHCYNKSLLAGCKSMVRSGKSTTTHSSVHFTELNYLPSDLQSLGEYNFDNFISEFARRRSIVLTWNYKGTVRETTIKPAELELIKRAMLGLSPDMIKEYRVNQKFIDYCLKQGILVIG